MAFNGSGSFSLPGSSSADYETGDTAVGTDVFAKFQDLADGLSNTLCRDGQSTVTASISFSGQRIVNLGDAVAATDALNRQSGDGRYSQRPASTVDNRLVRFDGTAGTLQGSGLVLDDADNLTGNGGAASRFRAGTSTQTGSSYTTVAADIGSWIDVTHASGTAVTLHAAPGEGAAIGFVQRGAGQITFSAAAGTLRARGGKTKSAGQYALCMALFLDGEWHLGGDIAS